MGASLVFVAICEGVVPIREGTWVAVLATMVYVSSYSLGIGPLTWVLMGELFPLDAREKASALVSVLNWLLAFVVTKTYFSLESSVGIIGICLVYASVCLIGGGTLFFLVPETKGKSLAEIEAHFSSPQKGI
ncbi:Solute carrier family 2, facilitated glucose transporter member 10 [Armadillidium nasatum]|uniref:Solute carrier family 2, facilitated glucose transporter member 10 n=1 Tax=Armadillidium nasatum TaxID=96803 RepID=A0A5N5SNE1_9CRUS|nr:Solute carrier family 2, facilitated glucose transporter member 10 [Armadillidium nasatum]